MAKKRPKPKRDRDGKIPVVVPLDRVVDALRAACHLPDRTMAEVGPGDITITGDGLAIRYRPLLKPKTKRKKKGGQS